MPALARLEFFLRAFAETPCPDSKAGHPERAGCKFRRRAEKVVVFSSKQLGGCPVVSRDRHEFVNPLRKGVMDDHSLFGWGRSRRSQGFFSRHAKVFESAPRMNDREQGESKSLSLGLIFQ